MTNNYSRHIDYDLRSKMAEATHLKAIADQRERLWHVTKAVREDHEWALERAIEIETETKEGFRTAHTLLSSVRQEIGELQTEFFRTGEEERDWH